MPCKRTSHSNVTTLAMHKRVATQWQGGASVYLTHKPAIWSVVPLHVQLRSVALMYREDESKYLNWAKDVGLLRLQQYQEFLRLWVWQHACQRLWGSTSACMPLHQQRLLLHNAWAFDRQCS
jgi:hypothetical protein